MTDPTDPTLVVDPDLVVTRAFSAFYGPSWARLATWLGALDTTGAPQAPTPSALADEAVPNPFHAVFCQDWLFRMGDHRELAALTASAKRKAPHLRGSPLAHVAVAGCVGYPATATNPQHPLRITDSPKILMLNALHDPATAYSWAANAHRQSRDKTVLLTYEGWGHGVYGRSDCARDATDAYLIDLTVPRDGTRCAAVEPRSTVSTEVLDPLPTLPGRRR